MTDLILIIIIIAYMIPLISAILLGGIIIQKHIESDRPVVITEFIKGIIMTVFPILNYIQTYKLYNILSKLLKRNKWKIKKLV